ncbi:MAG: hypothetical protein H6741_16115 [Alphaproteobacteria bacterium]|nr:hypothetical protein [Alphaproteobacteria bacterium]MCB9794239.1 hypothetical protein [Alphaproteobacteria bacterium]
MSLLLLLSACSLLQSTPESPLPPDFRECKVDADCVVAPSMYGLDRLPTSRDTCEGTCYIGVNKAHLETWTAEVARLTPTIPCDKEFEPCPGEEDWAPRCQRSQCVVDYAPRR